MTKTSGDDFSVRVESRVDAHAADVEAYSAALGLPSPNPRVIDQYLNMPAGELGGLDEGEARRVAAEVSAYAYYLQDQVNRKQVRIDKCTHEINKIVYPVMHQYDAFKVDDKVLLATLDDALAAELHDQRANALAFVARWAWLGQRLSDFANKLEALGGVRRNRG